MSILIVEDNPICIKMIDIHLRSRGYQTILAETAEIGLEQTISESDINLIITDVDLPKMNGIEFIEQLQDTTCTSEIPVIMCTYHDDPETVKEAVRVGCQHYLLKPINFGMLSHCVKLILDS